MVLIKDVTDCSTYSVRGLDDQIICLFNQIAPGVLIRIDDIPNLRLGSNAVHPYLQAACIPSLKAAIATLGKTLTINSAWRTIAAQMLLYSHARSNRCNISVAAVPGKSNHNYATAIDVSGSEFWRFVLTENSWRWLGEFDPMHYDCQVAGVQNIVVPQVKAFQQLWNLAHPGELAVDGDLGDLTLDRLAHAPAEGFGNLPGIPPRVMRFTSPVQSGVDIKRLQLALRQSGLNVTYDGVLGSGTERSIKEYQTSKAIVVDGIVGASTARLLNLT